MENWLLLWEKELYRAVNTAFLVCITMFGAGSYLGIASAKVLHGMLAIVLLFGLIVIGHFSMKGKVISMLCLLGIGMSVITVVGIEKITSFLFSYGRWFIGKGIWNKEWILGYELMQVVWIVLICYVLQMLLEKEFKMKLVLAGLMVICLVIMFFWEKELSKVGMALMMSYFVMVLMEWTQKYWDKITCKGIRSYMICMTPFLVLYLVVLMWMPMPENPYDWRAFKNVYHKISESLNVLSFHIFSAGRDDYGTLFSGFSDKAELGGNFQDKYNEIMTVSSRNGQNTNVYLIGKVFDIFDGEQWTQSEMDFSMERYVDTIRTLYAVKRYDSKYHMDYIYKADLNICYQYMNSKYLFAPLKTWRITQQYSVLDTEEANGSIFFKETADFGTEYEVSYYQINNGNEVFYEFLEEETIVDEEALRKVLKEFQIETGLELSIEELERQEQLIYECCVEDISLSEELQKYLEKITEDSTTTIDKLRAIESELSTFTYTNTPGKLPKVVKDASSFLDYFLLESREGYCNHFATAFVLLARAEGIPARYVQGYCIPLGEESTTVVTSSFAHAWPEVYIKNIGWIPFEPTPGYGEIRYTPWGTKKEREENVKKEEILIDSIVSNLEEEEEQDELSLKLLAELEEKREQQRKEQKRQMVKILISSGCSILVVGVLAMFFERFVSQYRYQKMTMEQKYLVQIRRNLKLLSKLGFTRNDGETIEEFAKRMIVEFPEESKFYFLDMYEEFLYSNFFVKEESIQLVLGEQKKLLQILKQRKKWMYLYWKIFF